MLDSFSVWIGFPGQISEDINKYDFLILYNEMCQHLEDLHNSVNQYFPNDQCMMLQMMLQTHDVRKWVKDPCKVKIHQ